MTDQPLEIPLPDLVLPPPMVATVDNAAPVQLPATTTTTDTGARA